MRCVKVVILLQLLSNLGLAQEFNLAGKKHQIITVNVSDTEWENLNDINLGFDIANTYFEQEFKLGAGINASYYHQDKFKLAFAYAFPYGPEYDFDRERLVSLDSSGAFDPWHFRRLDASVSYSIHKAVGKKSMLLKVQNKLGKSLVKPKFRPSLDYHRRIAIRTGYNMYQGTFDGAHVVDTISSNVQKISTGIRTHSIVLGLEMAFLQTANYYSEQTDSLQARSNITITADALYGFHSQHQLANYVLSNQHILNGPIENIETFSPLGFKLAFEWIRSPARVSFIDYRLALEAGYRPLPRILPLETFAYYPLDQFFFNLKFGFIVGYNLHK